eukprot:6151056-Lingulodinium_polyedra.AAC.1
MARDISEGNRGNPREQFETYPEGNRGKPRIPEGTLRHPRQPRIWWDMAETWLRHGETWWDIAETWRDLPGTG